MTTKADFLLTGGRIYTADPARPWAEAVAIRGGRFMAVGSSAEVETLAGPTTEVLNLAGRLMLPAFTDSHLHLAELALRATEVDATGATSPQEVAGRVRAYLGSDPGSDEWIRGGGWDPSGFGGVAPHCSHLDAVAPDHPVVLSGKELHSVWLNSCAMRLAGIDRHTEVPQGGVIDRDAAGEPTGILRDNAIQLVQRFSPPTDVRAAAKAIKAAIPAMWGLGIVAVHNASDTADHRGFRACEELQHSGDLGLRVLQYFPPESLDGLLQQGRRTGDGDFWLRVGGIKLFADGALGSRTALMLEPYQDDPGYRGVATMGADDLLDVAQRASAAGCALMIHAIGDRANREVLDVLAAVRRQETPSPQTGAFPLRHRVEHVQCLTDQDLPRLAQLDVIASVQPIHATADMEIVARHWGPARALGAYRFRDLIDSGARVVFGSDAPVERHDPLVGIHAAVTRQRADGTPTGGWYGGQRVSLAEAVDAYTRGPAYAAGEEAYRGRIVEGMAADLVVLSHDIFAMPTDQLLASRVVLTMLNGRVVYRLA